MTSIIDVENISFKYKDTDDFTLKNISFHLSLGQSLGILGPNGGGKSTLMKILCGLLKPTMGKIHINGTELNGIKNFPFHLVSYIPQSSGLNLSMPLSAVEFLTYAGLAQKIPNLEEKILEVSKKVGIENKLNFLVRTMSGGERQRLLIAKSLLINPKILLLDEPTKGLDSLGQDQLLSILTNIKKDLETVVIIVDHDINQVIRHCDKVLCLNKTSHWHDHKDLLTQNILEHIYHCEFEHLLIHEKELNSEQIHVHQYCEHDRPHSHDTPKHQFIRRK
jgi:zinc transport system ATP-binding protein